jgi:hypothetical protein
MGGKSFVLLGLQKKRNVLYKTIKTFFQLLVLSSISLSDNWADRYQLTESTAQEFENLRTTRPRLADLYPATNYQSFIKAFWTNKTLKTATEEEEQHLLDTTYFLSNGLTSDPLAVHSIFNTVFEYARNKKVHLLMDFYTQTLMPSPLSQSIKIEILSQVNRVPHDKLGAFVAALAQIKLMHTTYNLGPLEIPEMRSFAHKLMDTLMIHDINPFDKVVSACDCLLNLLSQGALTPATKRKTLEDLLLFDESLDTEYDSPIFL